MRLATWNVNSVRMRESHVRAWLARHTPDLLLLQEIKCEDAGFPDFADTGYASTVVGQKSYNGVAILSRIPIEVTQRRLPGLAADDAQARYVEVKAAGLHVGNLYLPNGNSGGAEGYAYKLAWMEALAAHADSLLQADTPCAFLGDYNICPTDEDYAPGTLPPTDALVRPESRARFRALAWLGLTDALRAVRPSGKAYTFWDYQGGAWRRDLGLRIDHAMLSPDVTERLVDARPDREARGEEQPSDHVPLIVDLTD